MWEQPPLLSAHSFRPAEIRAVGARTEDRTSIRGEGSKEELNIDEIEARYYIEQLNMDKTQRK